jgi:hypothetical protein
VFVCCICCIDGVIVLWVLIVVCVLVVLYSGWGLFVFLMLDGKVGKLMVILDGVCREK